MTTSSAERVPNDGPTASRLSRHLAPPTSIFEPSFPPSMSRPSAQIPLQSLPRPSLRSMAPSLPQPRYKSRYARPPRGGAAEAEEEEDARLLAEEEEGRLQEEGDQRLESEGDLPRAELGRRVSHSFVGESEARVLEAVS